MSRNKYYTSLGMTGATVKTSLQTLRDAEIEPERLRFVCLHECPTAYRVQVWRALLLQWRFTANVPFLVEQLTEQFAAVCQVEKLLREPGSSPAGSRKHHKAYRLYRILCCQHAMVGSELPADCELLLRVFVSVFAAEDDAITYHAFGAFLRDVYPADVAALCATTHELLRQRDADLAAAIDASFFARWFASCFFVPLEDKVTLVWDRLLAALDYYSWIALAMVLSMRSRLLQRSGPALKLLAIEGVTLSAAKVVALADELRANNNNNNNAVTPGGGNLSGSPSGSANGGHSANVAGPTMSGNGSSM